MELNIRRVSEALGSTGDFVALSWLATYADEEGPHIVAQEDGKPCGAVWLAEVLMVSRQMATIYLKRLQDAGMIYKVLIGKRKYWAVKGEWLNGGSKDDE